MGQAAGVARQRVCQVVNGYLNEAGRTVHDETTRASHLAGAEEKLARAMAIDPGHPKALKARAMMLRARGLIADALAARETLLARSPGDPATHRETALNLLYLGRMEEAVDALRLALASNPGFTPTHALLAAVLALAGEDQAARAAMAEFRRQQSRPRRPGRFARLQEVILIS